MSGLGAALLITLGVVLIVGGVKGTLLTAAHQIATPIPGTDLRLSNSPGPGAPGSGVTTQ